MAQIFDLIVIGTGSAASAVATPCRAAGWKVAVVDSRPFGGTCALRGCDPKKVLVGATECLDWTRRFAGKGIITGEPAINWPALMRFKHTFTDRVPASREESFRQQGIAGFHGRARFTGPKSLTVNGESLEARHVVIAAGAKPMALGIPGEGYLTTSEQFLDLDRLPNKIVFVGGGYISLEFAHVAVRCGAKVTVLDQSDRILPNFDPDLIAQLAAATRELGVDLQLQTKVEAIEKMHGSALRVRASREGKELSFEAGMAVHGAGRAPEIEDLNLQAAHVESDKHGVKVDEYLRSVSNPNIYAAGDAANAGPPLTPVAGYEGRIVAANLLNGNHTKTNFEGIPTVAFTIPPVAAVGLSEKAAHGQGLKFKTNHAPTSGWYSSRRIAERHSGYKILIEEGSRRLLGAHLLGSHAEEVINLFALAIRAGMRADELKTAIFSYPTHCSDIAYML